MTSAFGLRSACAISALALAAFPAHAQSAGEDTAEEGRENTIVVTGQKIEKSLQEVQTSATVFTEQRVEEEVLFDLDDALLRAPNVSVSNVATGFSLRGIGQDGVGFAGTGRTSQVYVDGLPLSFDGQQGAQSLWDVGQVEILLGPQSTIQGRNALGGAIIINTLDPTYEWEVRGRVQGGTQDTQRVSGAISGPIIADQLAFRIAYDYTHYDGDVREVLTGLPQEFETSHSIRGKLLFEPAFAPGLRVELTGEYIDTQFGEFNTIFAPVAFDDPAFSDFDPFAGETVTRVRFEEPETTKALVNIQYQLSDAVNLFFLGTFEDNFRDRSFGVPGPAFALLDSPANTKTYSAEFRTEFDFGQLTGWVGGYYFDSEQLNSSGFTFPLALFGLPFPVNPPDATITSETERTTGTENYAIFADFTYELSDQLSINLGARYDWEEFSDSGNIGTVFTTPANCTVAFPFGPSPCTSLLGAPNTPGVPAEFEAFLPRGSIVYSFTPDISLGLTVARGYRAGGAVLRQDPIAAVTEIVPFDPEFTTNYELAFRSQWLDGRLTVNANAFFTDWSDQQVSIQGPSATPLDVFVDNVGESELYGMELTIDFRPQAGLSIFATLGLLHTEFTDFPFAFVPGEFENLAGNEFPAAPNVTASAGFSYEDSSGFYTSWSASYSGEQESEVANLAPNRNGDYFLVNARAGFRGEIFDIYVFANNLFDERFVTRRDFVFVNTGTGTVDTRANARFQVNEPIVAGVGIGFEF